MRDCLEVAINGMEFVPVNHRRAKMERIRDFEDEVESGGSSGDNREHLTGLQKEIDMPVEEFLANYDYEDGDSSQSSVSEEILPHESLPLYKKKMNRDSKSAKPSHSMPTNPASSCLLRSVSRKHSDEDDEDRHYIPEEEDEWKKTIMVGTDFQASIPEGLCHYDDALPYENEDKLLWIPERLGGKETEEYLKKAAEATNANAQGVYAIPTGKHTRDSEQALFMLLQCGFNIDEALRRCRMSAAATEAANLWSEEECRNFENGLRTYGKDFHLIQQDKVKTRTVAELVQFYYLWKKTERHDVYALKARQEKKKYTLHPGITDYMDRFLDEQESSMLSRDRCSSPNVNSLSSSDSKRQHRGSDSGQDNHSESHSDPKSISPVPKNVIKREDKGFTSSSGNGEGSSSKSGDSVPSGSGGHMGVFKS